MAVVIAGLTESNSSLRQEFRLSLRTGSIAEDWVLL